MAARASRTAASTNANFSRAVRSGAKSWVELRGLGFKMPNVGANRPAEAGGVSPDCDDSTTGAGWAYDGCRSGSG